MLLKQIKNYFILVLLMIVGVMSFFTGISDLLSKDYLAGFILIIVFFMCFPQLREYFKGTDNNEIFNSYTLYAIILILAFIGFYFRKGSFKIKKEDTTKIDLERKKYTDSIIDVEMNKDSIKFVESNDIRVRLKKEIESDVWKDGLDYSDNESIESLKYKIIVFRAWGELIKESSELATPEVKDLSNKLKNKVISFQIKELPKLRIHLYKILKNKLWEENIDVRISGKNNTTLLFIGTIYANNKNIKESQELLTDILYEYRFKTTQYKWYKGSDEFTYYNIDSKKDNELIE